MMPRRTLLLLALVAATALTAGAAALRASSMRDAALAAASDRAEVEARLADLASAPPGTIAPGPTSAGPAPDGLEIARRVRAAAASAGLAPERIALEQAGSPAPVRDAGFDELTLVLRADAVTLRELTILLHALASADPASRARSIRLTAPPQPEAQAWQAEVTLAYLVPARRSARQEAP